jgi:hypothetical protein
MKRCPNGKRRVGRVCKRKPRAKRKVAKKRKKSPMTKYYVRGSKAKRGKTRYLTERELAAVRRERALWAVAKRDIRRGLRRSGQMYTRRDVNSRAGADPALKYQSYRSY